MTGQSGLRPSLDAVRAPCLWGSRGRTSKAVLAAGLSQMVDSINAHWQGRWKSTPRGGTEGCWGRTVNGEQRKGRWVSSASGLGRLWECREAAFPRGWGTPRGLAAPRGRVEGSARLSLSEGCLAAAPRRNSCAHRVRASHSVSEVRVRGTRKSTADRKGTGYPHPGR